MGAPRTDLPERQADGFMRMRQATKIVTVLALTMVLAACGRPSRSRLVVLSHTVWQVTGGGQIAPFPYHFPVGFFDSVVGSTTALPSPDGRWIAYGADYNMHVLDVLTRRQRQITCFGRRPQPGYTFAVTLAVGWSPDSRQLLVAVEPGEIDTDEGQAAIPKALYGFYVHELSTGRGERVHLPRGFEFVAWLPDDRILGYLPGNVPGGEERLAEVRPSDGIAIPLRAPAGLLHQARASADGKWLAGVLLGEQPGTAQIVKVDLATMSSTPLVKLSSATGNERPALSRHAEHVSYTEQTGMAKGIPQQALLVDRQRLRQCKGWIESQWVKGRTLAFTCGDQVSVLDVATGRSLSTYRLSAAVRR